MPDHFTAQIENAPQQAGVYIMRNSDAGVVYVGKSINIHKRLLQHAKSLQAGWSDRNHRWIYHVRDVSWQETDSELYALLLEDQLIKQYWPVGNVRQKDFLEYAYLAFSNQEIPQLLVINARERDNYQHVFGPFHNIFYAQDMADLVQMRFRLRTCHALTQGGCLQWEIGKCIGPCRSREAKNRYDQTVLRASHSLQSQDDYFFKYIDNFIQACSRNQEFEKAAHYHTMRHRYNALIKRQNFLNRFREHAFLIRENGRWNNTFIFLQGRLVQRNGEPVTEEYPLHEPQLIDRSHVIYQWLQNKKSQGELAVIDRKFFCELAI
jgi:excinuclease ABC subunit C